MPQPTGGDIYVSRPLTNISIAYMQDDRSFIADKVFPPVPVDHQYGMYYRYNKGNWFRTHAQRRAPRTESAGTGWTLIKENYRAEVQAVHHDISDQDRANQERPIINLDRSGTKLITRDMMLRRELDWATAYFGAGLWGNTDQTGVGSNPSTNQFLQWNVTASTPIEDIEEQRLIFAQKTGFPPNVLVFGPAVYSILKNHAQLLERIKYTQRAVVTTELMSTLFDVDRVLTPMAIENQGAETPTDLDADANMQFVYGKGALLAYANPSPAIEEPSAGYSFEWTGYLGAATRGTRVKKFRMEELASDRVEIESAYDFQLVCSDLGVYFADAVA